MRFKKILSILLTLAIVVHMASGNSCACQSVTKTIKQVNDTDYELLIENSQTGVSTKLNIKNTFYDMYTINLLVKKDNNQEIKQTFIARLKGELNKEQLECRLQTLINNPENEEVQQEFNKYLNEIFQFEELQNEKDFEVISKSNNIARTSIGLTLTGLYISELTASIIITVGIALVAITTIIITAIMINSLKNFLNRWSYENRSKSRAFLNYSTVSYEDMLDNVYLYNTSATKHVASEVVTSVLNLMKNRKVNVEAYVSTATFMTPRRVKMLVVSIGENKISGLANRHLGNSISGRTSPGFPKFPNETMDFSFFTFFILMNGNTYDSIFHVHAVPTINKWKELRHMRYNNQLDLQLYPVVREDSRYLRPTNSNDLRRWIEEKKYASRNRGLICDEFGKKSIIKKLR
ncbi:MAG: hypothetical protein N4A50_12910 [Vallitalea sp.]|jgi:hypothetical protein|nr:hypothetical protein [Vallitalea sp.]